MNGYAYLDRVFSMVSAPPKPKPPTKWIRCEECDGRGYVDNNDPCLSCDPDEPGWVEKERCDED